MDQPITNEAEWRQWQEFEIDVKNIISKVTKLELDRDEVLCELNKTKDELSAVTKEFQLQRLEWSQQKERDFTEISNLERKLCRAKSALEEEKKKLGLERRHKQEILAQMKPNLEKSHQEKTELETLREQLEKEKKMYKDFHSQFTKSFVQFKERMLKFQHQFKKILNAWSSVKKIVSFNSESIIKNVQDNQMVLKEVDTLRSKLEISREVLTKAHRDLAEKDSQIESQSKEISYLFDSLRSSKQKQMQQESNLIKLKTQHEDLQNTLILQQEMIQKRSKSLQHINKEE